MAREGKKLELYEILAAKRAKGKIPTGFEGKPARQANALDAQPPEPGGDPAESSKIPGIIIDDSLATDYSSGFSRSSPHATARSSRTPRIESSFQKALDARPAPEPRPRSAREVVFALDTAFIFFTVILALLGSSYFLGYKRGQEEKPVGMTGVGDIDIVEPGRINLRHLSPAPRATIRPPEQDFTLILRTEPAVDDLPERLELELAEAVARGKQAAGGDIQGFIFRTSGADPRYVLSVGLGRTANDAELSRLLQVYNKMEGITLSREPRPYIGCRIAPIRELGAPVY